MTMKMFYTPDIANTPPAEAGTPNLASLATLETEIQQGMTYGVPALAGEGMKELEGMLK